LLEHGSVTRQEAAAEHGYDDFVPGSTVANRKATADEVRPHSAAIRQLVVDFGLSNPCLRGDGTVVVHSSEAGYGAVTRLSISASEIVGEYVHVITDDVPGAVDAREL
jgi:hypothetical protein